MISNSLSTSKPQSPNQSQTTASKNLSAALLEGLNPEQQQAVLRTDGPLLIIAGAGTGKTRVIVHRIAHILQSKPELTPANLLALTFSRKAAREMQERVEGLLGTYADELDVFTFHSFCHRFLLDHALELGLPSRFRLLDRVEPWIFLRKLLPEIKPTYYWNLADPTDCLHAFLRFIGRAKDELVTPENLAAYVKQVDTPIDHARAEEVARVYRTYQKRMRAEGYLDFGDLLVETITALKKHPELLAQLQTRYRYILVDEFQDTNVAQIALLNLLAGRSGNLCVVGDDDQAIYRFRGASFASFSLLKRYFPNLRTLRLTQNYRSTKKILDVADRLIRHNEPDRYDPEKKLWTQQTGGVPVEVVVCQDDLHEAQNVVATLQRLYQDPALAAGQWDRMAVLYRSHAHRKHLVNYLRMARIPFVVQGGTPLFDQEVIKDLLAFLYTVIDPADSVHLFRVLSHSLWGFSNEELVALSRSAKQQTLSLGEVLQKEMPGSSFIKEWEATRAFALGHGLEDLLNYVIEETSYRLLFRLPPMEEQEVLIFLGRFLRFVQHYLERYPDAQDLASFLQYLEAYQQAGGESFEEEEEGQGQGVVRLMTIHQSKGLEFDWVILLGMVQGKFPSRGRPESIPFPVELIKEPLPQGDYHVQEERRLCYVATTRARQGLFMMTRERAYHRPSLFVRQMLESAPSEEIFKRVTEMEKPGSSEASVLPMLTYKREAWWMATREVAQLLRQVQSLRSDDAGSFSEINRQITESTQRLWREKTEGDKTPVVTPFLQDRFSFSQLESYRFCPLKYRYQYLYQIPVRPAAHLSFGVDMHAALENFFNRVIEGPVPPLEELLKEFQRFYVKGRYGDAYQDEMYQRLGIELLTTFYQKHAGQFPKPLMLEKTFALQVGPVWMKGVVDRIDPLPDGGVEIIDYKTGKPKSEADEEDKLQLRLYALACREVFQLEPKRISFYFLRNNEKLSFEQKKEHFQATQEQITDRIQAIQSGDWTPAPSERKCRLCDFRKLCPASMA